MILCKAEEILENAHGNKNNIIDNFLWSDDGVNNY